MAEECKPITPDPLRIGIRKGHLDLGRQVVARTLLPERTPLRGAEYLSVSPKDKLVFQLGEVEPETLLPQSIGLVTPPPMDKIWAVIPKTSSL